MHTLMIGYTYTGSHVVHVLHTNITKDILLSINEHNYINM